MNKSNRYAQVFNFTEHRAWACLNTQISGYIYNNLFLGDEVGDQVENQVLKQVSLAVCFKFTRAEQVLDEVLRK